MNMTLSLDLAPEKIFSIFLKTSWDDNEASTRVCIPRKNAGETHDKQWKKDKI